MDCAWESSDDEQHMQIDLEGRQEEDVKLVSKKQEGYDPANPQDDYDPSQPTSDIEDALNNSDYDPAEPTITDDECSSPFDGKTESSLIKDSDPLEEKQRKNNVHVDIFSKEEGRFQKEGKPSVDSSQEDDDNDGRWDSQADTMTHNDSFSALLPESKTETTMNISLQPDELARDEELVPSEDEFSSERNFSNRESPRDQSRSLEFSHRPSTPPVDTDDNTQASNLSAVNNLDDATSDVPEVSFDDSDFILEKEPFEPGMEKMKSPSLHHHSGESSGWKSEDSQKEEETSWRKSGSNGADACEIDELNSVQRKASGLDEEALVDLFREESEPDKDAMDPGERDEPMKKSKKKVNSKKLKKKGKKLKKGQGKKGSDKQVHPDHGDQRFVEISRERPSVDSKEDGELEGEISSNSRKVPHEHEDRLSFGLYDHVIDSEFANLEEEGLREPGEIVEVEGKKKGSKKKEKKERRKKKTRREVATIEDDSKGDEDSQKFPSFLAGFFVQDEGEEDIDGSQEHFLNSLDQEEAAELFRKSSSEKKSRKHQESGEEDSVRSFDHNLGHIESQDRRLEESEHRRSKKQEERRRDSRERHFTPRDFREIRYEREHRHEMLRDKEREREKERRRSERSRERARGRDKERDRRDRERERERERVRQKLRRSEDRHRRGTRSRSHERRHRSRSYERHRRSRSRERSRQIRRRSRSYDRSIERERDRGHERERSKRRRREQSRDREFQRRVRRASYSRSRSPRRRTERASSNKENRDESHRRRRQRYQDGSDSEERESCHRSQHQQRRERERSSSSSSTSSQSSSSHPTPYQNTQFNNSFITQQSSDEDESSDVILVEPERIVINLDEEEDPPSRVDITHANSNDNSATLVDGESIPPPPEMSGGGRTSALIEINPEENGSISVDGLEEETGDATPTRDEASDIARTTASPPTVVETDYDPAHPTEEDGEQEVLSKSPPDNAQPAVEKGPVPPDHSPPKEVRPSPPPAPAESVTEPPILPQPHAPAASSILTDPVMRLINPLLLQQQRSNHTQQSGLLPFPNMSGQPPRFMNWPLNQNSSGQQQQQPPAFVQGQRHMRPLFPNPDGRNQGFRPVSGGGRPPFPSNLLPSVSQQLNLQQPTGPGPHSQLPITSMPPLAQLTSLLPALEKAKLAAQDSTQAQLQAGSGNSLLGKPPLTASLRANSSPRDSLTHPSRADLSESTEVVDMDMSPVDEDCELELPSPNSDSDGSRKGKRRSGRRGESHHSKKELSSKSTLSTNKGVIQPVVYLKALSKVIEKLTPKTQNATASGSQERSKQASSKKKKVDVNDDDVPASAVDLTNKEKYIRKLHLQERVIDEVKLAIKPFYSSKKINKEQYKLILRKAVPKVCHSKSGNINPQKIQQLVEAYVTKMSKGKTPTKKKRLHPSNKDDAGKEKDIFASVRQQNGERPKKLSR